MDIKEFIQKRLSKLLSSDIPDEMIEHMISLETPLDMEDFCYDLLDKSNPEHKLFVTDFINKRKNNSSGANRKPNVTMNVTTKDKKKKKNSRQSLNTSDTVSEKNDSIEETDKSTHKYKRTSFTPFRYEESRPLFPGRRYCNCGARGHRLVGNCLECGRIACEQEGSGPCFFCSQLVVTKKERSIINSGTEKGNSLVRKLMSTPKPKTKAYEEAVARRDRMRDADINREERQKVIDDESDYFPLSDSVWIDKTPKKEEKKEAFYNPLKEDFTPLEKTVIKAEQNKFSDEAWVKPEIISSLMSSLNLTENDILTRKSRSCCISLHQPWASLVVSGIKKQEGRDWKTEYRGPLWIASGSKQPSQGDIEQTQMFYQNMIYEGRSITFPTEYPIGMLLGRVNIDDCCPLEECIQNLKNCEVNSKYVWTLSKPAKLKTPIPMKGKHKLYYLPENLEFIANKLLENGS